MYTRHYCVHKCTDTQVYCLRTIQSLFAQVCTGMHRHRCTAGVQDSIWCTCVLQVYKTVSSPCSATTAFVEGNGNNQQQVIRGYAFKTSPIKGVGRRGGGVYPILDTRISFVCSSCVRLCVTFRVLPLDSEMGWTGELWSNTNLQNSIAY